MPYTFLFRLRGMLDVEEEEVQTGDGTERVGEPLLRARQ